jgi:DNA-binding transcriptional regulator of glucitol operon
VYRFAWHPRWLLGHVIVLAAAVTMVFLGRWQLDVSEHKGFSLQNFGYALQWWAFTLAALVIWVRVVRDHAHAPAESEQPAEPPAQKDEPVAYRRYVMPTSVKSGEDPELDRYNAYLRSLEDK